MKSKKCQKYMKQYQERNYAPKIRKIEKNDLRKHCDGGSGRKAAEASHRDSLQQSRKEQEEKVKESQNEEWRQEESVEALERRQEGIQGADQGRSEAQEDVNVQQEERKIEDGQSEVGSKKSRSSCSRRRKKKVMESMAQSGKKCAKK